MSWFSVQIDTDCLHAEILTDALLHTGALSASIEDADAGTPLEMPQFGEPGSEPSPKWKRSRITALFSMDQDVHQIISQCASMAGFDETPAFILEKITEQNWVALTQSQFEPLRISERLWVVPSWHQPPYPEAINLILDPGMAFGTGSHPTTRMCMQWLDKTVFKGAFVLDYGCGSGILAITAAKLGAKEVIGIDIDKEAVKIATANANNNKVSARFYDSTFNIKQQFDIVIANIVFNPLTALAPLLFMHVRPRGQLLLSGILADQADKLIAAYQPFIQLGIADFDESWVLLSGQKLV